MKKIVTLILSFTIVVLIMHSCIEKKEILELDDIENGDTADVLSFKKNGEIWKPRKKWNLYSQGPALTYNMFFGDIASLNPNLNNLYVEAERRILDDSLDCIVCDWFELSANFVDTGYATIIKAGISGFVNDVSCDFTQIDFSVLDSNANNFLRIIEIDTVKNAAAGYFEFTTIDTFCNDTVAYTEGRFRVGFEE
ncbi:MAG: hypothetical protein AAF573_01620 [Bacteroidota bacterium]